MTISDKEHVPGHHRIQCHTSRVGKVTRTTCHPVWVPPVWKLYYDDKGVRHGASVAQGTHDRYAIGSAIHVRFFEGHLFGTRYGQTFMAQLPAMPLEKR